MPGEPQQLDIFADSHDVMLRNDVLRALERRNALAARAAWQALASAYAQDASLAALDLLAETLEADDTAPLPDHEAVRQARHHLTREVTAAARQALGEGAAAAWLQPLWQRLAERAARLPFDATRADDHAAALWLQGAHWTRAAEAVEGIESWRRIPAPLAWMCEAHWHMDRLANGWALLAELAWLAPSRLDGLLRRLPNAHLAGLFKKFGTSFEGAGDATDLAWFPAWVLIEAPKLAPALAQAWPSQHSDGERAMRLLLELLGLEREGRHAELLQRRRALRDLHAGLYSAYMATR